MLGANDHPSVAFPFLFHSKRRVSRHHPFPCRCPAVASWLSGCGRAHTGARDSRCVGINGFVLGSSYFQRVWVAGTSESSWVLALPCFGLRVVQGQGWNTDGTYDCPCATLVSSIKISVCCPCCQHSLSMQPPSLSSFITFIYFIYFIIISFYICRLQEAAPGMTRSYTHRYPRAWAL